jgi:hypothetical protein
MKVVAAPRAAAQLLKRKQWCGQTKMAGGMATEETERLFVVPPAEFVAARKAMASALKAAGRRAEAAAIEKRPRPSVSTWATNQVARSEPDLIRQLGEVTERLRAAGGPDYGEAIAQHRALLKTLRAKAEEVLTAAGLRAALPALAQVLQNLRAGMASAQVRPLVATGQLIQDIATTEEASPFESAEAATRAGERPPPGPSAAADASTEGERERREAEGARDRERERREAEGARDRERERREAEGARDRERERREAEILREKERERREQRATLQREAMRLRSSVEAAEAAREVAEAARDAAAAARDREEAALAAARDAVAAAEVRLAAARATLEQKSSQLGRAEASLAALD